MIQRIRNNGSILVALFTETARKCGEKPESSDYESRGHIPKAPKKPKVKEKLWH